MEDTFNRLKRDRQNSVDNLIKWMKDSKIVDGAKVTEDKARKLFEGVADSNNIEIDQFKKALTKLATEQQKNVKELTKILAKEGPRFVTAVRKASSAAASTFKESLAKSK